METTLETSENENYNRNEWKLKLQSKRVKMKTTLETSEVSYLFWVRERFLAFKDRAEHEAGHPETQALLELYGSAI